MSLIACQIVILTMIKQLQNLTDAPMGVIEVQYSASQLGLSFNKETYHLRTVYFSITSRLISTPMPGA